MSDDFTFTDFDQRMLHSLDVLHELCRRLIDYGDWFLAEWLSRSDELPPFFEIHEWDLVDGQVLTQRVLVLDSHICPSGDCGRFLDGD